MSETIVGSNPNPIGMPIDKLKKLVSIEYPGRVLNEKEALRTMGGLDTMSQVHSNENRKIELRFRPDDPFCKPTHGERHSTSNLLIKIVKKVKKNKVTLEEEVSYHTELEGMVGKTYKFQGLCDFQYLPMLPNLNTSDDGDKMISIMEEILPQKLETLDWLKDPAPVFMSPPVFSRMDTPMDYTFKKDTGNQMGPQYGSNVIGRMRKKRTIQTIFLEYNCASVPSKPRDLAIRNLKVRFVQQDDIELIRKLFEERPIWTKAALSYVASSVEKNPLKLILAATAYIFKNGPWRNAWIRIGFDPRQEPLSRNYQILDYRVNQSFKNKVIPKRSYSKYHQPHKYVSAMRSKTSTLRQTAATSSSTTSDAKLTQDETSYIYRPGMTPLCRQMFYQYCDLYVPEIEELLAAAPVLGACDERYGWYPSSVEDECRRILNNHMSQAFAQLKPKKKSRMEEGIREKHDGEDDEESEDEDNMRENNLQSSDDEEEYPEEDEDVEFPDEEEDASNDATNAE